MLYLRRYLNEIWRVSFFNLKKKQSEGGRAYNTNRSHHYDISAPSPLEESTPGCLDGNCRSDLLPNHLDPVALLRQSRPIDVFSLNRRGGDWRPNFGRWIHVSLILRHAAAVVVVVATFFQPSAVYRIVQTYPPTHIVRFV